LHQELGCTHKNESYSIFTLLYVKFAKEVSFTLQKRLRAHLAMGWAEKDHQKGINFTAAAYSVKIQLSCLHPSLALIV